jgi:hypothetical protein
MILKIFADTKNVSRCSSEDCGATITWAQLAQGQQKKICFDGGEVVVLRSTVISGRVVEEIDTEINSTHFETCPDADRFRK